MALTDGLVAYYKLDESSGNATDSVWGFTMTNTNTCTFSAWKINNGANTHPTGNKYFEVANDLWLNGSSQNWTVSMWIYPSGTISTQQVFLNWSDNWYRIFNYIERFSSACRLVRVRWGIAADVCSKSQTFSDATWYHICWRYNWTTLNLKINDWTATTFGSSGNGSWTWYTDTATIGAYNGWGTNFKGMADEVWFWNRNITDDEVTALYNGGSGIQYPFTTPNSNFLFFM